MYFRSLSVSLRSSCIYSLCTFLSPSSLSHTIKVFFLSLAEVSRSFGALVGYGVVGTDPTMNSSFVRWYRGACLLTPSQDLPSAVYLIYYLDCCSARILTHQAL